MSRANLSAANLHEVDLTGAILIETDLREIDLTDAILTQTDLSRADLSGARLDRADLSNAKGLTDKQLESTYSRDGIRLDSLEDIRAIMLKVCQNGSGVPQAAEYIAGSNPHSAIVVSESGSGYESGWIEWTPGWEPLAIKSTELVICVLHETIEIESCKYIGRKTPLIRSQRQLTIRIVAAQTGQAVADNTYKGSLPRKCGQFESSGTADLLGGHVGASHSLEEMKAWVKIFGDYP